MASYSNTLNISRNMRSPIRVARNAEARRVSTYRHHLSPRRPERAEICSLSPRQRWMIFVASTGGALEVFDFAVYGFFAQSIGREFFPARIGVPAETLSFAVLAAGSMSRLVGGIFLGRLGDKYGRRIVFTSSAMVAAVSTLLIGILPSYESLGVAAPMLLVLLRITQGLCLGGELPGAVIYAVETAHAKTRDLVRHGVSRCQYCADACHQHQSQRADDFYFGSGPRFWLADRLSGWWSSRSAEFRCAAHVGGNRRICAGE